MKYLLDTSAVSELVRPKPDPRVAAWIDERDESGLYLSVLTLGELHHGIALLAAGRPHCAAVSASTSSIRPWKRRDSSSSTQSCSLFLRRLKARAETRGEPVPVVDSLIAATALVHNLIVVTRNVKDFVRCGVSVHNPWT
ncbi:MAG: type II toxin-antitoxin system VapC family toxin [Elusimicrobia bacterium]|nr:type II toxin-antitoxin system VapC family toxin [Elusimicrobiota bacterium]